MVELVSRIVFVHNIEYDTYKTLSNSQQAWLETQDWELPGDGIMHMDAILDEMEGL